MSSRCSCRHRGCLSHSHLIGKVLSESANWERASTPSAPFLRTELLYSHAPGYVKKTCISEHPANILLLLLPLLILPLILPEVFPEDLPERLGEYIVRKLGQAGAQRLATEALPKKAGGGGDSP